MALLLRGTLGCRGHFYKDIEATVMLVHLLKEGLASLRREPNTTRALRQKFLPPCLPNSKRVWLRSVANQTQLGHCAENFFRHVYQKY
jgi:hypothetical protein